MPDNEDLIRRGRGCVRLIEAVDVLLQQGLDKHELVSLECNRPNLCTLNGLNRYRVLAAK
jgi:hypothetical protein